MASSSKSPVGSLMFDNDKGSFDDMSGKEHKELNERAAEEPHDG